MGGVYRRCSCCSPSPPAPPRPPACCWSCCRRACLICSRSASDIGVGVGVGCVCREWSRGLLRGRRCKSGARMRGREGKCSGVRSLVGQVTYHYLLRVGFDDYHNHDLWEES